MKAVKNDRFRQETDTGIFRKCEVCGNLLDVSGFNSRKKYCTKCGFIVAKRKEAARKQLVKDATNFIRRKGLPK